MGGSWILFCVYVCVYGVWCGGLTSSCFCLPDRDRRVYARHRSAPSPAPGADSPARPVHSPVSPSADTLRLDSFPASPAGRLPLRVHAPRPTAHDQGDRCYRLTGYRVVDDGLYIGFVGG